MEYIVEKKKVKHARVKISGGRVFVVVPYGVDPQKVIDKAGPWIEKTMKKFEAMERELEKYEISDRSPGEFRGRVIEYALEYSRALGTTVERIFFRKMKTRWGSCSSMGSVTINTDAQFLPEKLLRYLVFHEVAHRLEMNHKKGFWEIVAGHFPDYKELDRALKFYRLKIEGN